jgi:hypothetical protein
MRPGVEKTFGMRSTIPHDVSERSHHADPTAPLILLLVERTTPSPQGVSECGANATRSPKDMSTHHLSDVAEREIADDESLIIENGR